MVIQDFFFFSSLGQSLHFFSKKKETQTQKQVFSLLSLGDIRNRQDLSDNLSLTVTALVWGLLPLDLLSPQSLFFILVEAVPLSDC